jgi:hypothetical protein
VSGCAYEQGDPYGKIERQSLSSQDDGGDQPKRVARATAEQDRRDHLLGDKCDPGDHSRDKSVAEQLGRPPDLD